MCLMARLKALVILRWNLVILFPSNVVLVEFYLCGCSQCEDVNTSLFFSFSEMERLTVISPLGV